jgi:hypothetical protein
MWCVQESVKLQIVGDLRLADIEVTACNVHSAAGDSDAQSSYSSEGADDDVELEGLDFGLELPEEA